MTGRTARVAAAAIVTVPLIGYPLVVGADGARFPSAGDCVRKAPPGETAELDLVFGRRETPAEAEQLLERVRGVGYVGAEVRALRERHRQIHTWVSANLLQTLFREALVDRVNLWVCPVVIGQGKKLFPEGTAATRFEQVEPPKAYPGGVMLLRYRRLEGPPETVTEAIDAED